MGAIPIPSTRILYELVGIDRASPAFDRAGRSASGLERTITKAGKAVALAGGAIGTAAVAIGYESVKAATSFQTAMEKIRTQAGGSQKDVAALSQQVLKLGTTTQQGPQALADSLFHLKSVGLDNVKAMQALRTASNLAAVGGADLESTTNALAGAWRSGIKGARDFGTEAATLNAIIGAGNMRMSDLVDAMGTGFLPTARSFGLSLKSVGAALALMTDEGIPANVAATRLRMSINLLGAPSNTAAAELKTIGLSSASLANAMRSPGGLVAAITLLKTHLDESGLSATQAAQLLSHAFGGGRSSSAILTLVNNLSVLQRKQQQINDTTSRYGADVTAQRKTAAAQFALLRSNLDVIGIRIGSALLPPLTKFTGYLATTVVPDAEKAAGAIGSVFKHIIPVDTIKADWQKLVTFFTGSPVKVKYDPGTMFTGNLLNAPKPKPLHLATADLFNLPKPKPLYAGNLINVLPGGAFTGATEMAQLIHPLHKQAASGIGATLSSALAGIDWGKIIASAITAAASGAQQIGNAIITLMGKVDWLALGKKAAFVVVPFVVGLVDSLVAAMIDETIHHPLDMLAFVLSLFPAGKFLSFLGDLFKGIPLVGKLLSTFGGAFEKAGKPIWTLLGKMLKLIFGDAADRILGWFGGAKTWLASKGQDILYGLWYGAERIWAKVTGWLGKIKSWVLSPFISAGKWLLDSGGRVIEGLLGGLKAKMAGIGSWIKSTVVDPVINWVKHWFGIHSPSTVMAGIGGHLVTGLLHGLSSIDGGAIARTVFGSLPSALAHIVEKGLVSVASLPGRALKTLEGLGGSALSKLGGLLGGLFGGGSSGTGPAALVSYAKMLLAMKGWGNQFGALNYIINAESGWQWNATNPTSGAYGIPQALPPGKMAAAGADWRTNPLTQLRWMILDYLGPMWGSPARAAANEQRFHWYGAGTPPGGLVFTRPAVIGVGERGPERVDVTPLRGGDGSSTDGLLRQLLAELKTLNRNAADAPDRTGAAVGGVINGTAAKALYGGRYSSR